MLRFCAQRKTPGAEPLTCPSLGTYAFSTSGFLSFTAQPTSDQHSLSPGIQSTGGGFIPPGLFCFIAHQPGLTCQSAWGGTICCLHPSSENPASILGKERQELHSDGPWLRSPGPWRVCLPMAEEPHTSRKYSPLDFQK